MSLSSSKLCISWQGRLLRPMRRHPVLSGSFSGQDSWFSTVRKSVGHRSESIEDDGHTFRLMSLSNPISKTPAQRRIRLLQEVTEAIIGGGSHGLAAYGDKCTRDLSQIVELVRGTLTKLERASCSALIVIDVHARDVVIAMSEQGVEDVTDFNWESQLRFVKQFPV